MPEPAITKNVTVVKGRERKMYADRIAVEASLAICLNGQKLVTLLCTPQKKKCLALGFLRSGGLLGSLEEVAGVRVSEDTVEVELRTKENPADRFYGKHAITPGGGRGIVFFDPKDIRCIAPVSGDGVLIQAQEVSSLIASLQERAEIFKATGGTHSAALADTGKIIIFFEDIGRHNAVDKVIGESLLQGIPLEDKVLICSGRLSSEILLKAARLQLPLLISRAAPTTLSVELADALNITLIGFARGTRMNIYTHPHRVR